MLWLRLLTGLTGLTGVAALAAATMASGCSGSQASPEDASVDYLGVQPPTEGGGDTASGDGGAPLSTTLRLANMSPDLGPIDFCWRVSGATSFTGPVLGTAPGLADAGTSDASEETGYDAALEAGNDDARDASEDQSEDARGDGSVDASPDAGAEADAPGEAGEAGADSAAYQDAAPAGDASAPKQLGFAQVSSALTLPAAGTFDLALVAPGQLSCSAPRYIGQVTLDAGKTATVVVHGLASADGGAGALGIASYFDEPTTANVAAVRFIHAAFGAEGTTPAPVVSVSAGTIALAPEVVPGHATTQAASPAVDSLGYLDAPVVTAPTPFVIDSLGDAAPQTWTTAFLAPGVVPGTSHTGFVVSLAGGALGVVWCGDGTSPGVPGTCALLPAP